MKENKYNNKSNPRDGKSYSNKNKRNHQHAKSRESKETRQGSDSRWDSIHSNDPAWWNQTSTLFNTATQVPFNRIAGRQHDVKLYGDETLDFQVPPIMVIDYMSGIGKTNAYSDAPNRAFQMMYSYLYSKTTGAMQFPQYSVAHIVTGAMSIAQNIAVVKRAYGVARLYSSVNQAYPRTLITALGFEPDSVIDHLADLRLKLNNAILDFNSLPIPNTIKAFARQYMLANSVFLDNASAQAQIYAFRPINYYVYADRGFRIEEEGAPYTGIATLISRPMPYVGSQPAGEHMYANAIVDINEMFTIIDEQISALRNSSDFGLVAGSLIRAFPDSNLLKLDYVDENYVTPLTADDPWVSYQIHNMNAVGCPIITDKSWGDGRDDSFSSGRVWKFCEITGDPVTNLLIYNPAIRTNALAYAPMYGATGSDLILNTFESAINADWLMESTRMMSFWKPVDQQDLEEPYCWQPVTMSTEFVTKFSIYRVDDSDSGYKFSDFTSALDVSYTAKNEVIKTISSMERFHKGPRFLVCDSSSHSIEGFPQSTDLIAMTGDYNHWTTITEDQLTGINTAGLLSIFGINT